MILRLLTSYLRGPRLPATAYAFQDFELDLKRYELRRNGHVLKLEKIPMELLILLVSRKGELVSRDEIIEKLWGKDVFVETEHGINTAIRKIRQALNEDPENSCIKTVVGKGYRFSAPISVREEEEVPGEVAETEVVIPSPPMRRLWIPLVAGVAIFAIGLAINVAGFRDRLLGRRTPAQINSLAVIPLENLSGDKNEDYFADGMTDELITDLAKNSNLRVISRTSVMRYKNTRKSLPEIGRELGVDAIIEGTAQRSGNRVKVRAQLIRAADDRHLWADTFERDMPDVLALQSEVASSIARQVQMNLLAGRPPANRTINPAAYEAYLRGRYAWNRRSEANLQEGIQHFQQAIALEPSYAEAYSGMADSYAALGYLSYLPPKEAFSQARAAAEKAISLDPSLAEAHASLAYVHFYFEWNWAAAEAEFRKAIELNPNYATAHDYYSYFLLAMRRYDEARHEIDRALQLDPLSLPINTDVAFQMFYRGRYDDAIVQLKKALEMNPKYPLGHLWLGRCYQMKGMYDDSLREYKATDEALPNWAVTIAGIGNLQAIAGKHEDALHTIERLDSLAKNKYVTPYGYALVYAGMKDKDKAFRYLNRAYDDRSNWLVWLRFDPRWEPIHSDPRFADLVRRIGYPET